LLHIASASGANVAIVVGWSEFITRIWPQRQTKFGLVMLFLGFYLVLAEFSASIVRATLGASYRLAALYLWKRPVNALWSLGVSAGLMLLVRPAYLLELSFQLSCLATLGLALFSDFSSRVTREKSLIEGFQPRTARQSQFRTKFTQLVSQCFHTIVQTLSDSFKMCLAAQVFITPYLWLKFDVFTPISLIANPSLLWMTPLITQLCLGLLMTTTWMGQRPLEVGWISLRIMGQVLNFTAQLFLSSLTLLSQLDRWLLTHHLIWGGWIGWWLLSGFLVVKTINLSAQSSDDTF
ncbi:MAG TPA: hypothetical protein DEP87_02550, partial [Candidatus Pacebacteria bacterium]|nr:hypothetical protein [Candidatus Paceibacterota bacterium]